MPRYARLHAPGALVHVIARFVNRQFRLAGAEERTAFLERIPRALKRGDWTLHAYALMSTHVHLALLAGEAPVWPWLMSLHISVARWLNRAHRTFGPVFAERATTVVMAPARMGDLVAYLHNNPVRAGVAREAAESGWTSHRAWTGQAEAPPWLGVERGLHLAGFDGTEAGRRDFDRFVRGRLSDARDAELSGRGLSETRRRSRVATGMPVEVTSPVQEEAGAVHCEVLYRGQVPVPPRWEGKIEELLRCVAAATGVTVEQMCSGSHQPAVVRARRVVMLAGVRLLRRKVIEVASALAISGPGASYLLGGAADLMPVAREVADALRQ